MIGKYEYCHEAYFGLGKILFSKNQLVKAIKLFELALDSFEPDPTYCLWAALTTFKLYKQCPKHRARKTELAAKYDNKQEVNALFILLSLSLDVDLNSATIRLRLKYKVEDLATMIKQANKYKGYLAWAEIWLRKGRMNDAIGVYEDLIEEYPGNTDAYFKLWSLHKDHPQKAMDVAERMFLCCTNFYTLETKIAMNLIYSESLFKTHQYLTCFEFLQNEFSKFPIYSVLLYYYGKYVVLSGEKSYFGSGIGSLQECLRVCIPERAPFINYYIGEFYAKLGRPGKVQRYWEKAKKELGPFDSHKISKINDYYHIHEKFFEVVNSTKKIIKKGEGSETIYCVSESKLKKLIPSLNSMKEDDPITIGMLKSDVFNKVQKNKVLAQKELRILLKEYQDSEEVYMKYWSLMKEIGNTKELEEVSIKLQAVSNDTSVPTNSWVDALFKHSETLVIKGNIEEAIKTLKRICFILPPMPLPRLNYIDKSLRIKDELLQKIREEAQIPTEVDNDLDENSIFEDDQTKMEVNANDSMFSDFNMLNLGIKPSVTNNLMKQESDRLSEKRVSFFGDLDNEQNDRSIILDKKNSITEGMIEGQRFGMTPKVTSGIPMSPAKRKEFEFNDPQLPIIRREASEGMNMSDFDMSNISISRPIMTGRHFEAPVFGSQNMSRVSRSAVPRLSLQAGRLSKEGTKDGSIKDKFLKPQTMQETNLLDESHLDLGHESEGFAVYSDLKFLYQIGKICAESGKFLEEGILCLDDYLNLLNFFNPTTEQQNVGKVHEMKTKAIYLVGLIFYQIQDYEESERFLNQVKMDLLGIREKEKYDKCERMIAEMFQKKFDIYSDEMIHSYFYPEFDTRKVQNDSFDFSN